MSITWLHRKHPETGEDVEVCPECDAAADTALTYCTACGYDIVQQTKIDLTNLKPGV